MTYNQRINDLLDHINQISNDPFIKGKGKFKYTVERATIQYPYDGKDFIFRIRILFNQYDKSTPFVVMFKDYISKDAPPDYDDLEKSIYLNLLKYILFTKDCDNLEDSRGLPVVIKKFSTLILEGVKDGSI